MSANSKTETPPAATGPPATSPHSGITSTKSARVAGEEVPDDAPEDRVRDDRWDEVRRDAVGEILDVWLAGLGFLDCLDDLLERRVRTDLRRLNDEDTVLVNGGPDDLVALTFLDGDGLAGDHRLVNSALPVDDDAVGRDLFAGTDLHAVAHGDILQWHFHFDTVLVDEGGRLGLHFEEFPKGVTTLPFRAGFEIVAERDEHEDQRGSVEVQTPRDQSGKYRD